MKYINSFYFASARDEEDFFEGQRRTCYDSFYPFQILPKKGLSEMKFSDVTILYGGNGSGKTTVLNIIATKLEADRMAPYNKSNFYNEYIDLCDVDFSYNQMENKRIITSDDVFDYMLDIRQLNERIDTKREERFDEYMDYKYSSFKLESIEQVDELRKSVMAKRKSMSQSKYVRQTLIDNVREYSNGESAYRYFVRHIKENGLYILDEPENSLSPGMQLELIKFIKDSVRHFHCQFIISTHSPFILAMDDALVYDLDQDPVCIRDWHLLENVLTYYDFFDARREEFEKAKKTIEKEKSNKKEKYGGLSKERGMLTQKLVSMGLAENDTITIMALIRTDKEAEEMSRFIPTIPQILVETAISEVTAQLIEKAYSIYSKKK